MQTIHSVFPSCRAFRESARNASAVAHDRRDFANMVVFCTKTAAAAAAATSGISFRPPREQDMLGTLTRRKFLVPTHEVLASHLVAQGHDGVVLRANDTGLLDPWARESAMGHWAVMRTLLPAAVWEKW
jgi:hypothetical protein